MVSRQARTKQLDDGWEISVVGAVVDDGGWTGGHTSSSVGAMLPLGASADEVAAAIAEIDARRRAEAAVPHKLTVTLRRGDIEVLVHDEERSARDGTMELRWPPIVSETGVLLRRTLEDARDEEGRVQWGSTTLRPWLVRPNGVVEELPFELGVAPLCALPDGRYLLPGADALWRDSFAEPLSALGLDGRIETLQAAGQPLSAPRIVATVAPDWFVARAAEQDEWEWTEAFPWDADAARVDVGRGTLTVRLVDDRTQDAGVRWLLAEVPVDGSRAPGLAGRGVAPGDDRAALPAL